MGGVLRAGYGFEILNALEVGTRTVDAYLKAALQLVEQTGVQQLFGGIDSGTGILLEQHAARVVDNYGNHVLLRLEGGDAERRPPEHDEEQTEYKGLNGGDGNPAQAFEIVTLPLEDCVAEPRDQSEAKNDEEPHGPSGGEKEFTF